ncbi:MAG: pantoate--beta-alanine ligase [Actinomycetota bacterium]|nr:pantoate--beta-alanine ligase [Actinomycetota bacterium]
MKSSYRPDEAREDLDEWRLQRRSVGFVPTMGALHKGHMSLIDRAKSENDKVVVSIFVNPLQFNDQSDFDNYPSTLDQDRSLLEDAGVDLLFSPTASVMHPMPMNFKVSVGKIAEVYEGYFRPGHFDGVATVVAKLMLVVGASKVYFGEKDIQQCLVVKRMVEEFHFPNQIEVVKTYREVDGLAFSSRNVRLSTPSREIAPLMYRYLSEAARSIRDGADVSTEIDGAIKMVAKAASSSSVDFRYDYVDLVDGSFNAMDRFNEGLRLIAAWTLDGVRLIDNLAV